MTAPHPAPDGEAVAEFDRMVEEVLAICGGDNLAAIKSLLVANDFLERELELTRIAVSFGYSRGWHRKSAGKTPISKRIDEQRRRRSLRIRLLHGENTRIGSLTNAARSSSPTLKAVQDTRINLATCYVAQGLIQDIEAD